MEDPLAQKPPKWMEAMDEIFFWIYIIEALLKIFAMG